MIFKFLSKGADHSMANFISSSLAEHKLPQLVMQGLMVGVSKLIKSEVSKQLDKASELLRDQGCDHDGEIESLKSNYEDLDLFAGLHNQYSQIKYALHHSY